jgi:flagellum-specific peptidoglycan hydrolase FlgJ
MKVIPKLQQGNTIESDNTKVVRPEIHEPIKAKPKQYSIVDLGGEPSNDTRSAAERNRDYWHPIKGAKARFKASMSNETNPLVGIERTILPSAAGAALVTTPAAVVGGALGNMTVDKLTGGWGNWLEDKTGIPSEIGIYTNPGAWYGGAKGYKIGKDKLITKSIRPTYKKRIKKAQQGMRFVSYNPVSNPTIDYTDITNPINPFSEYNYNTTYDKPEALVVPVRDTDETDVVANNHTAEPVINKPVASKPVTDKPVTANSTWKSPYTNRKQWSTELINAYKKAGITNDNAIRMLLAQDALESSWGRSAQGKYNFGNLTTGSSWKGDYVTGNDKNAKGEAIKQKFRSYNSMDEYAADKIQFLKRLYDFDENDDINKFVAKLTGSNKGKRRYAEAANYAKVLTGVYNGIPKGENGMIIKY